MVELEEQVATYVHLQNLFKSLCHSFLVLQTRPDNVCISDSLFECCCYERMPYLRALLFGSLLGSVL